MTFYVLGQRTALEKYAAKWDKVLAQMPIRTAEPLYKDIFRRIKGVRPPSISWDNVTPEQRASWVKGIRLALKRELPPLAPYGSSAYRDIWRDIRTGNFKRLETGTDISAAKHIAAHGPSSGADARSNSLPLGYLKRFENFSDASPSMEDSYHRLNTGIYTVPVGESGSTGMYAARAAVREGTRPAVLSFDIPAALARAAPGSEQVVNRLAWPYVRNIKLGVLKDDFAPGLPAKGHVGDFTKLKPGQLVDFIVQHHAAERAGAHYDVRLGTKDLGLFSWATKKELPKPGEMIALHQQPLHRHDYKSFEGRIGEGYGKGDVSLKDEGRLLITKVSPRAIGFTRVDKKVLQRFLLVRPEENKPWLLRNTTPTAPLSFEKEHFKLVRELPALPEGAVVQPKVDGASSLVKIVAPNKIELLSFRTSKTTGHPIVHTERVLHGKQKLDIPKKYVGTVLRGEIYGVKNEKAIPPQELGGILNSKVEKSIEDQKARGIELKNMLFDVRGEKDKPYLERLELLREIAKYLPKETFHLPEVAHTRAEAEALLARIRKEKHPLTREGVVIHTPSLADTQKLKLVQEHDVFIKEIFRGEGKYKDAAGGFHYSLTPKGPVVGKVGTGLSDKLREDLWKNSKDYVGRRARVQAQEKLPSGALRAPSLLALHEG